MEVNHYMKWLFKDKRNFLYVLAVDCGLIVTPQNGSKLGEKTTYPHSVRFACDEGFILLGSVERYCLSKGMWSGQQALCQGNRLFSKLSRQGINGNFKFVVKHYVTIACVDEYWTDLLLSRRYSITFKT